ncbi:MAG: outer membrane beta-barrel protein [Flavobacteriales bacterium]
MMRTFAIFLLALSLSGALTAQKKFEAGLWAGPVATQMSGDGLAGWDKVGFSGGAWVRTNLNEKWRITGGLQFTNKGSRTERDTITFVNFAYHLNYIEMPITAGYLWRHWEFQVGVVPGILISQEIRTNTVNTEINPPFESYELGGVASGIFSFSEKFALGARVMSSVLPVRPTPNFANRFSYYERGNYHQVLNFLVQYRF